MVIRVLAFVPLALLGACHIAPPMQVQSSFETSPSLQERNPSDIAVLQVEDGTVQLTATPYLNFMRESLTRQLPNRSYAPLSIRAVDAALRQTRPGSGESILARPFLERAAAQSSAEAVLALRVDRWDESRLLSDKRVTFEFQTALVANDGELLWSGSLSGWVKAGGRGAAPLDATLMARSCAEVALAELLTHLKRRLP